MLRVSALGVTSNDARLVLRLQRVALPHQRPHGLQTAAVVFTLSGGGVSIHDGGQSCLFSAVVFGTAIKRRRVLTARLTLDLKLRSDLAFTHRTGAIMDSRSDLIIFIITKIRHDR